MEQKSSNVSFKFDFFSTEKTDSLSHEMRPSNQIYNQTIQGDYIPGRINTLPSKHGSLLDLFLGPNCV